MTLPTFLALLLFSFVSSITPGPNNIMLLASGANFGFRRTIPHAIGIAFGFGILLTAVGLGLGVIFDTFPVLFLALKICGALYLLYLAWKIAMAGQVETSQSRSRPMTFLEAALFQWVNPKAWVMAVVAMSLYTSEGNYLLNVAIVVFAFCIINLPSVTIWAAFGVAMGRLLSTPVRLRTFNIVMAMSLVLSLYPMLIE